LERAGREVLSHLDISVVENVLAREDIVSSGAGAIGAARVRTARGKIGIVHDYRRLGIIMAFYRWDNAMRHVAMCRTGTEPVLVSSVFLTPSSVSSPLQDVPMGRSGW
jgi:hypothetical protein